MIPRLPLAQYLPLKRTQQHVLKIIILINFLRYKSQLRDSKKLLKTNYCNSNTQSKAVCTQSNNMELNMKCGKSIETPKAIPLDEKPHITQLFKTYKAMKEGIGKKPTENITQAFTPSLTRSSYTLGRHHC